MAVPYSEKADVSNLESYTYDAVSAVDVPERKEVPLIKVEEPAAQALVNEYIDIF